MTRTAQETAAGPTVPGCATGPEAQVEAALTGLLEDLATFQAVMTKKFDKQEERLTMLDRKTMNLGRPALAGAASAEVPHTKAFAAYVRSGDDDALRGLVLEGKAMNTQVAADGGYLVDPQTSDRIANVLASTASLRRVANVVNVESGTFEMLVDRGELGAEWADETTTTGETAAPQIERIVIPLHELAALPKASQRLLDDAAFDIESWLAERIADKFARAEASAFVSGDGSGKPKGFLTYPTIDNDEWNWGSLGYVTTGSAGTFGSPDPIVDLVYALGAEYRANGAFVMNSKTAGTVRKMKDADGRFLWSDSLADGEPARLMGYPVLIAEDMPDIAADAFAIAFGDFGAGYTVAERPEIRILRDPFSAKPNVLFYATKRVGGAVSDFAAIKLLKFAAS